MALKQIGIYLKRTKTKGLIMRPNKTKLGLDLFADEDFAGLFAAEDRDDPISVNSITGIPITFGEVSIYWSLKLQSEILLSTLETEYIALSQGMYELVSSR